MATVGMLGDIIFTVTSREMKTFDEFKCESSTRYASHDRHLQDTLIEFVGNDNDTASFSMYLSAFLGVNPKTEMDKLDANRKSGIVMRLVLGEDNYGKWVITKNSKEFERYDPRGNLLVAKVNVTLEEYAER